MSYEIDLTKATLVEEFDSLKELFSAIDAHHQPFMACFNLCVNHFLWCFFWRKRY